MTSEHSVCILIPCLNEEASIGEVIREFRLEFPGSRVLVVDNGSTDATARIASEMNAEVLFGGRRGKA